MVCTLQSILSEVFSFTLGYNITQTNTEATNDEKQLHIIDYNEKNFGQELKGKFIFYWNLLLDWIFLCLGQNYDVVYDCVGGIEQWTSAQEVLKRGGHFLTIVGDDTQTIISVKSVLSLVPSLMNRKFWSTFGSSHHKYGFHFLKENSQDLDDLRTTYIETGKVKPLIDTVFDWRKDGVEALYSLYEKSKSGKAQGKLILKIADEE